MNRRVYIYGLCDPESQEIKYVGASTDPEGRLMQHTYANKRAANDSMVEWLNRLKSCGLRPEMFILEETNKINKREVEHFWMNYFVSIGANLLNIVGLKKIAPQTEKVIYVSPETHCNLKQLAYSKGLTLKQCVESALGEYVNQAEGSF